MRLRDRAEMITVHVAGVEQRLCAVRLAGTSPQQTRRFVLLHGNPASLEHFEKNVEFFRRYGDVALYDAPGFGLSPPGPGPLSLDFLADVAIAFAQAMQWTENVDFFGQSHGAAVAQTVAVRSPELVRSIVLLGSVGCPAHPSMWLAGLPGAATLARLLARRVGEFPFSAVVRPVGVVLAATSFAPDPIPPGFLDGELRLVLANPTSVSSCILANAGDPTVQLRRQAHLIAAPVLMIHGLADRLVPIAFARRLFSRILPGSPLNRFEAVPGGHMLHLSRPDALHRLLEGWLE